MPTHVLLLSVEPAQLLGVFAGPIQLSQALLHHLPNERRITGLSLGLLDGELQPTQSSAGIRRFLDEQWQLDRHLQAQIRASFATGEPLHYFVRGHELVPEPLFAAKVRG
jgi:hypothetical protein